MIMKVDYQPVVRANGQVEKCELDGASDIESGAI